MALEYKALKHKLTTDPFTQDELAAIARFERYIDQEITEKFERSSYGEIYIELSIANFDFDPFANKFTDFGNIRKTLMAKELQRRYEAAGWAVEHKLDDGRDGNMSGPDYWVLKGKN